jgi:hypothetical protein
MWKKNVASQKIPVYAHDILNDTGKTGDAANITARVSLDGGAVAQSNDANPTELDATYAPGVYIFDMTQAEMNCEMGILYAKSATANIKLDPVIYLPQPDVPGTFGAVNDASPSTTEFDTDITEATADHFKDAYLHFLSGANTGQSNPISAYALSGGKGVFTTSAFTDAPATGDRFVVLGSKK